MVRADRSSERGGLELSTSILPSKQDASGCGLSFASSQMASLFCASGVQSQAFRVVIVLHSKRNKVVISRMPHWCVHLHLTSQRTYFPFEILCSFENFVLFFFSLGSKFHCYYRNPEAGGMA